MNLGRLNATTLDHAISPSWNPSWTQVIISTNYGIHIPKNVHSVTIFNTFYGSMWSCSQSSQNYIGFHTDPPLHNSCGGIILRMVPHSLKMVSEFSEVVPSARSAETITKDTRHMNSLSGEFSIFISYFPFILTTEHCKHWWMFGGKPLETPLDALRWSLANYFVLNMVKSLLVYLW